MDESEEEEEEEGAAGERKAQVQKSTAWGLVGGVVYVLSAPPPFPRLVFSPARTPRR